MVKHNFYAGPSILPREVIESTADAVLNFNDSGLSVLEISHRSKDFQAVMDEARSLFHELLSIPENYTVLLLGGGASMEFCRVPFNFLKTKAAYLDTGTWAHKAIQEAAAFGEVDVIGSSKDQKYKCLPKGYVIPADADYLHYTTNNTVYGTEFLEDIESPIPLIADMSSDIFSRPIDVSKYICIYGGAQKNLAPSGLSFIIVRNDALGKMQRHIPTILDYKVHVDKESMFHTPPALPIYSALQTLRWIKKEGGVKVMQDRAIERAELLYNEIERNAMFEGTVVKEDRSRMNICFVFKPEYVELEKEFLDFTLAKGIVGIKGHRTTGGFRASCYNAMPISGVQVLVDAMKEFEQKHVK
ncbi:3-phosphoserine/phosphohydroxythreonine transaminase [Bacteroides propionicifaciens]|uniref:3-phosphoserine/phosphohydroxythreonine transaminase n=1 Tax=Bacteroides propionicifaciens TaxID=392838 RepID=UPI00036727F6|nr:3-phosphoserine/phosphohydroxythreonine transaminase [Bacteroides propionicifaciens]